MMGHRTAVRVTHPNRETIAARATRSTIVALLLLSAVLAAAVIAAARGVSAATPVYQIPFVPLFAGFAWHVTKWRSGALPMAASVAAVAGTFAALSAPSWFQRTGIGYAASTVSASTVGLVVLLLAATQLLVIVACLVGVAQRWYVEVDIPL